MGGGGERERKSGNACRGRGEGGREGGRTLGRMFMQDIARKHFTKCDTVSDIGDKMPNHDNSNSLCRTIADHHTMQPVYDNLISTPLLLKEIINGLVQRDCLTGSSFPSSPPLQVHRRGKD